MRKQIDFAIIGAGRLGAALTLALREHGFHVAEIVSRKGAQSRRRARDLARSVGARAITSSDALNASVVWICVPDAAIADCARSLAKSGDWKGRTVFHSSGALSSDELQPLRNAGAAIASVHPMMSFVRGVRPELKDVTFAVEGDAAAVRLARRIIAALNGTFLTLRKADKVLYHAWGAFGSPLVIAELAAAELVASAIGLPAHTARKTLAPMLRQSVENYIAHGAAAAFSGPMVRGDVETVRRHLKALKKTPLAKEVYVALARAALHTLPVAHIREMQKELQTEDK